MHKPFSLNDQARELLAVAIRDLDTPAEKLKFLHDNYAAKDAITEVAKDYCDGENSACMDREDFDPEEDSLDAGDFALALEEELNDLCESLLHEHEVTDDLAEAKAAIVANADWKDYAKDVDAAIESASREDDDVMRSALENAGGDVREVARIMSNIRENDSDHTSQHAASLLETHRRDWLKQLCERIASGEQDIDISDFASRLELEDGWDWSVVEQMLVSGAITCDHIEDQIDAALK